jgi:hypothetical protein
MRFIKCKLKNPHVYAFFLLLDIYYLNKLFCAACSCSYLFIAAAGRRFSFSRSRLRTKGDKNTTCMVYVFTEWRLEVYSYLQKREHNMRDWK